MNEITRWQRLKDELAQVWTIAIKDIRVYYLQPPMIMFGLILPFFLFFSFSIKRNIGAEAGIAQLLAMTTFFTASSAGPVIIPLERRMGTYDRLLAAPMSLATLLIGQTLPVKGPVTLSYGKIGGHSHTLRLCFFVVS